MSTNTASVEYDVPESVLREDFDDIVAALDTTTEPVDLTEFAPVMTSTPCAVAVSIAIMC